MAKTCGLEGSRWPDSQEFAARRADSVLSDPAIGNKAETRKSASVSAPDTAAPKAIRCSVVEFFPLITHLLYACVDHKQITRI